MARSLIFLVAVLTLGCQNSARSQQQTDSPTLQQPAMTVADSVHLSRRNAITRAVEAATPAIVSVNVIEVQRIQYDPLANFFRDPFFQQFFPERRSQILERQVQNLGSGFVISPDGYIVTNDHVAGNATRITVSFPNGQTLDGQLVGSDEVSDLALVKVDPPEALPHLTFATDEGPIVGEWAIALGNPFGLFEAAEPTVTVGVVSAAGRDLGYREGRIYRDMIQTDASINRGNSGGPLVNARGEVMGVNTAIYSESGGSVGLGFAVPADKAQRIIDELRAKGSVDRAYYTGLLFVEVDDRIADALDLDSASGIVVAEIESGSPGENAGFLRYDVIVAMEGETVSDTNDFLARLHDFRPGDTILCMVIRDNERIGLQITIGRMES